MWSQIIPINVLREDAELKKSIPRKYGVYKWWCSKKTFIILIDQLKNYSVSCINANTVLRYVEKCIINGAEYYCFYVGESTALYKRIIKWHLGNDMSKSTLRRAINSLKNGKLRCDEEYVNSIVNDCYIQWIELSDKESMSSLEKKEINSYIRVLNIKDSVMRDNCEEEKYREVIVTALKKARSSIE